MSAPALAHLPHLALGGLVLLLAPSLAGAGASPAGATARDAADLRAAAEAVAGAPVLLDPRVPVPACPQARRVTLAATGRSVEMVCPATGWRIVAPVAAGASAASAGQPGGRAPAIVRRGDLVTISHAAPGFTITMEAIAEGSGGPGERILLRNRVTGARFPATIAADGSMMASR